LNRPAFTKKNISITILISMLLLLLACTGKKAPTVDPYIWLEQQPKPWKMSTEQVNAFLPELGKHFPDFQERIKAIAIWRIGTPYEIFKLGEEQAPDTDPIIRLDVSDCTGHVLTTLAFGQADTWTHARQNMIQIHYKRSTAGVKQPTYESRWHFTADRIRSNPFTVDISQSLIPHEKLDSVTVILNHKKDGKELLPLDWERKLQVFFIPNDQINAELMSKLPPVCGVAFVKPSFFDQGIVIGHEGMIIDQSDLIHASQSAGETVRLPFLDYYFPKDGKPFFGGIMIYTFKPLPKTNTIKNTSATTTTGITS